MRPLETEALHHAVIEGCLGLPALRELHVGAASLQAGGVRHELRGAHRLDLPEELHGAAGDVLAFLDTFPRGQHGSDDICSHFCGGDQPGILGLTAAQHELVVLNLAGLAQVHGASTQGGSAQGNLFYGQLSIGGQPDILG